MGAEGAIDAPVPDVAVAPDAVPDAPPDAPPDAVPDAPPDAFVAATYVQGASDDTLGGRNTVVVPFAAPQSAGHVNVVAIGWLERGNAVTSITDTSGNTYVLAGNAVTTVGQSLYYANGIPASVANSVTVTLSGPATEIDVRIAEYAGLATTNLVDQAVTASAVGTAIDSGIATTTHGHDLLVGACTVAHAVSAGDPTYTLRVLTPNDGNIIEDKEVTALGIYNATATQNASGGWVMTLVALRAAN